MGQSSHVFASLQMKMDGLRMFGFQMHRLYIVTHPVATSTCPIIMKPVLFGGVLGGLTVYYSAEAWAFAEMTSRESTWDVPMRPERR